MIAAEKELENFVKADEVDKLISDIGYVTLNNGKRVKEAREAYDKLTDYQKTLVKNYDKLLELEEEYDKLVAEAVERVEKLILLEQFMMQKLFLLVTDFMLLKSLEMVFYTTW